MLPVYLFSHSLTKKTNTLKASKGFKFIIFSNTYIDFYFIIQNVINMIDIFHFENIENAFL